MSKDEKLYSVILTIISLILAALACSQPTDRDTPGVAAAGAPSVTISSPPSGTSVKAGEEVSITSMTTAAAGVDRVELSVSGLVVRSDAPPGDNPASFSVVQAWTPEKARDVIVSVVAYDTAGAVSEPAMIVLQVTAGGAGAMPTSTTSSGSAPTPTEVPAVPGGGGCKLNAAYVADVTIPDNTMLASGTAFVKTWRIRNSSTCDWISGFDLVFVKGDRMGGETEVAVPATASGDTAEVSVHLTAPSTTGIYRGEWHMRSDEGTPFGSVLYVQIVVPGATEVPTAKPTQEPTKEPTETPTEIAQIRVFPPFVPENSGSVSDTGEVWSFALNHLQVGDNLLNVEIESFVTFDIRSVPADVVIDSATLNLGDCYPYGDGGLGVLSIFNYQYGELDASDFNGGGTYITSRSSPYCHGEVVDVLDTLKTQIGQKYYQLSFRFDGLDFDYVTDGVEFTGPKLFIVYHHE